MVHLDEFLLLLFPFHMQLSLPLKNINRFLWFWSSSTKMLNRLLNRMGGRERFFNSSLKQNTKIMAPVFNRFCLSASKTKIRGFCISVWIWAVRSSQKCDKKNQPTQVLFSFPSFSSITSCKTFPSLAGHCQIQCLPLQVCSNLFYCQSHRHSPKQICTYTNICKILIFICSSYFNKGFIKGGKRSPKTMLFTFSCFNIFEWQKLSWP